MSTLGSNIRAYQTKDRYILPEKFSLSTLTLQEQVVPGPAFLVRYEIKAILGTSAVMRDGQPELDDIFISTREMICREVFNEYVMPLVHAKQALHDLRYGDARVIIEAILNNMHDAVPFKMPELSGARR